MTDVPSHSWVMPTLLEHAGVDFLQIGCNPASSSPDVPSSARKKSSDPTATSSWGPRPSVEFGRVSTSNSVPASVPSLFHNSIPWTPSSATKNKVSAMAVN